MLVRKRLSWAYLLPLLVVFSLLIAISCGGSAPAEPIVVEKEVIKEVPVEKQVVVEKEVVKEVIKEVPVEKEVIKEVIKEIEKQVVVVATPIPAAETVGIQTGGVISAMAYASARVWDPHLASSLSDIIWISPLYNQVIEFNPETDDPFDLRGDLAETWEVSPDGLTYTFHLAENAVWHDGQPMTADDVVFSLERMTGRIGEIRAPRAGQIKPYYKSSEATDAHTVRVDTNFVAAAFLPFLAVDYMKIVPKHIVEAGIDIDKYENLVGSGPYTLDRFTKDSDGVFVKNPNYFKEGFPRLDGINSFIITDPGTEAAQLTAGQILMNMGIGSNMNPTDQNDLAKDQDHLNAIWYIPSIYQGLMFNVNVKPYDDPRVRKAIYLALDRDKMLDGVGRLGFESLGAPFAPGTWFGKTEEEIRQLPGFRQPKDEDIAEAKRLMAEAGYPDGFKTTLTIRRVGTYPLLSQLTKPQLKKALNIDVDIKVMESAAGYKAYISGDWEISNQANGFLVLDPDGVFAALYREGGTRNYPNWSDPKVNGLFEEQTKELDRDKRRAIVQETEDYLLEGTHNWAGLFWTSRGKIFNEKVQNIHQAQSVQVQLKYEHIWLER